MMGWRSVVGVMLMWLAAIFCLLLVGLVVVPSLVLITAVLWIKNMLCDRKAPEEAKYDLRAGIQVSARKMLEEFNKDAMHRVESQWVAVGSVGPSRSETWTAHTFFIGMEDIDKDDARPPLLLIHGVSSTAAVWSDLWAELAKSHRVVAIDLPAFGRSDTPECLKQATPTERHDLLAHFLSRFIEKVGISENLSVMGHSYGGHLSLRLAAQYPESMERLILADAVGILPTLADVGAFWGLFFKVSPIQSLLRVTGRFGTWVAYTWFRHKRASADAYFYYQLLGEPTCLGDTFVADSISLNYLTGRTLWQYPELSLLLQVKARLAFIYGALDTIIPPSQGLFLKELLGAQIPLLELPNTGHSITGAALDDLVCDVKLALEGAQKIDPLALKLVPLISTRALVKYGSYWSKKDTTNIVLSLYQWLRELKATAVTETQEPSATVSSVV